MCNTGEHNMIWVLQGGNKAEGVGQKFAEYQKKTAIQRLRMSENRRKSVLCAFQGPSSLCGHQSALCFRLQIGYKHWSFFRCRIGIKRIHSVRGGSASAAGNRNPGIQKKFKRVGPSVGDSQWSRSFHSELSVARNFEKDDEKNGY